MVPVHRSTSTPLAAEVPIERLSVQGFAGLPSMELPLRSFNVLIGPQAVGKSLLAKLLFFNKSVVPRLIMSAVAGASKDAAQQSLGDWFKELFPPGYWGDHHFEINYRQQDLWIKVQRASSSQDCDVSLAEGLYESFAAGVAHSALLTTPGDFQFRNLLAQGECEALAQNHFGSWVLREQIYVPAGRSFFAHLQANVFSFLESGNSLDPFLRSFGRFYESLKSTSGPESPTLTNSSLPGGFLHEASSLMNGILRGSYLRKRDRDFLSVVDGREVPITNCSSGQQEALPVSLILKYLPYLTQRQGFTLYLEEPEAHLFPKAQREILELSVLAFKAAQGRLQPVITTHSPYLLTALNNLLQAGRLLHERPELAQDLDQLVPQSQIMDAEHVAAFAISQAGCEEIINRDEGLISADFIDEVSTDLAVQFDQILDLIYHA